MPTIADLKPLSVQPATEAARLESAAKKLEQSPSFRDTFSAALMQGPVWSIFNSATNSLWFDDDPSFSMAPEDQEFKDLTRDLDPVYWPSLAKARSYEHAAYISNVGKNRQKYREQLGAAGVGGIAATIVASVADPVYLAAGIASGGAAYAAGGTRVAQLTRAGLISAGAFGGIEEFKRSQDEAISIGEVALAAVAGGLGTAAGGATAHLGRGTRFVAGGAANAIPTLAYDVLTDADRNDVMLNVLPQFFLGGVMSSLSPATRPMDTAIDQAAKKAMRETEFDIVKSAAEKAGKSPWEVLTVDGVKNFHRELRPIDVMTEHEKFMLAMDEISPFDEALGIDRSKPETVQVSVLEEPAKPQSFADLMREPTRKVTREVEVPDPETASIAEEATRQRQAFADSRSRLNGLDPEKKLSRTEVDAILEGTGYKTENQGWPTVAEMAGYLEQIENKAVGAVAGKQRIVNSRPRRTITETVEVPDTRTDFERLLDGEHTGIFAVPKRNVVDVETPFRESELTFGDRQRIIAQVEAEMGVVQHFGPDATVKKDPSGGNATESKGEGGGNASGGPAAGVGAASPNDPALAGVRVEKINEQPGDLNLDGVGDDPASFRRFSMAGMAQRSESPDVVRLANMLGRDDLLKQGGKAYFSGTEQANMWHEANVGQLKTVADDAYLAYHSEEKAASRTPMSRAEFNEAAGKTYRNRTSSTNRHIQSVIDVVRRIRKSDWERTQRHLVKGTIGLEHDPYVLDRLTDRQLLDEKIGKYGPDKLIEAVTVAVAKAPENAGLTPKQHAAQARAYVENAAKQQNRWDIEAANRFEYDNAAVYAEQLRRHMPDLTPDEIDGILFVSKPSNSEAGVASKFRRQIRMDTSYEHDMGDGTKFSVDQVIEHDIEKIERLNSKYLTGRAAQSEIFRQFSTTERNIESVPQLMDELSKRASNQGIALSAIEADLRNVEVMLRSLTGQPIHPGGAFDRPLRVLRNVSFARVIGTATGIRNFFEVFGAMPEFGMKVILEQIPDLDNTFKRARAGDLSNELGIELADIGIGVSELTHKTLAGVADAEGAFAPGRGDRIESGSRRLADITSTVSLIGPIQTWLERMIGRFISQKWLDMALSDTLPSAKRLGAMTLDEPMARRILAQIKGPNGASYSKSAFGNKLTAFNWDGWDDIEALTAFRQALYKQARRLVYKPDITQMSHWMTTETGKTILQLRTFAIGSYESKTLFNVQMRDRTAYLSFMAQLIGKGASYVGLTYLYAQSRDDKREYLRKRLETGMIARAAFSQSEIASIIPIGVDALQAARGREPYFAFARTTGLGTGPGPTGFLLSNPTADTIDKTMRMLMVAPDKILGAMEHQFDQSRTFDPRFTQRDAHSIFGGLPWQNMLGVRQIIQAGIKKLPRERK